jgi:putative peptidoglycan lipid II flippase
MALIRSVATVGGLTLVSRVLGFVRDQLIAFTLGTGFVAQAFFIAQRFPNLFRTLFAEGAFNNAFVPQFARRIEADGKEEALSFAIDVFSALFAWLIVFSAIAMIAMPWLIYAIAPGFHFDQAKLDLTVMLTRICFPYLLFISLTALQSGVLNSLNRFTAAAAAPILLNLAMIGANVVAWWLGTGNSAETGVIFAWGVTISGIIQFTLLAIACQRAGMPLFPKWPRMTPGVRQVIRLSIPGIVSGGIMQINLLIATSLASTISGAVAYLYYAERLYQLPLGVIGVAVGVVLLPDLSRKLRAGDDAGALDSTNRALEFSLLMMIPAAVALIAIPVPILRTVFEHGAFTSADTRAVAPAIIAFAAGLPAFAMTKAFQPNFYAREDTKTPMRIALMSVAVNIAASLILSQVMGHVGIALATTLAAWANTLALGLTLQSRRYFTIDSAFRRNLPRILASSVAMGLALYAGAWLLSESFASDGKVSAALLALVLLVGAGFLIYFALIFTFGVVQPADLRRALKR